MRQAQQGAQAAYADLLVILTSATRRYARTRLGPVPWVDDIVQETLLTVHAARHSYDSGRPFAPWFYAIVKSRLVDAIRHERRVASREVAEPELVDLAGSAAADVAGTSDDIDVGAIRRALGTLPDRQREVITGLKYRDESVREIARRLGMSESAVKVTAHRGYKAMRRLLGGK